MCGARKSHLFRKVCVSVDEGPHRLAVNLATIVLLTSRLLVEHHRSVRPGSAWWTPCKPSRLHQNRPRSGENHLRHLVCTILRPRYPSGLVRGPRPTFSSSEPSYVSKYLSGRSASPRPKRCQITSFNN